MLRSLLVAAGLWFLASSTRAQVLYFEDFSNGTHGWTLDALCCGVQWKADALPASTPNGSFLSAPASLNFNNDVDYDGGYGTAYATSPPIDISSATGVPMLSFWCNNQTVELTCDPHERTVLHVPGHTSACFGDDAQATFVCTKATWHPHLIALDSSWDSIQLRFELRTDGLFDQSEGWFIDDIGIYDVPVPLTYCTAKTTSSNCDPLGAWGGAFPSASDPERCSLFCTGVPAQKNGMFFYGFNGRASTPFLGGTLCVQPPVERTFVLASGGTWGCSGYFDLDFNAWIQSGHDPALVPGTVVDGQWWFRDPQASFQAGLSDGIELLIQS